MTFQREIEEIGAAARAFPWESRDAYAAFLGQTYYFARMTTRLLALAGSLMDVGEQELHERFLAHAREERGHDEILVGDLNHLGVPIERIPEFGATAAFYQVQYYWIEHRSPKSLFGYILLLEGMAVAHGTAVHERLLRHYGSSSTRFFKVHTESDPDHVERALSRVQQLGNPDQALIARNLEVSADLYTAIIASSRAWMDGVAEA
jgi:hypothetical protein